MDALTPLLGTRPACRALGVSPPHHLPLAPAPKEQKSAPAKRTDPRALAGRTGNGSRRTSR